MKAVLYLCLFSCSILTDCQPSARPEDSKPVISSAIDRLTSLDVILGKPKPGEWLYINHEDGQSYEQYIRSRPVTPNDIRNKIYLQPIGNFSTLQSSVIQFTADYLEIFFNLDVTVLPAINDSIIPNSSRRFQNTNSEQLLTTPILGYLQKNVPADGLVMMAVTSKDLFPGNSYNFVFGQARSAKRVGVSSLFRYSTAAMDSSNYHRCLERLIKTSSHEIGHMLSLRHCTYAVCVMNGSNSLSESDSRPNRLCSDCHRKLHWNLQFDVVTRLSKLQSYFLKHKMDRDYQLIVKDLKVLD